MVWYSHLLKNFPQFVTGELPDERAGFRKGGGTRDQVANTHWTTGKAREFQKNIHFCFTDYAETLDYVDHNKLWEILKEMEHQTTSPPSWETCMWVMKQQLELDVEQQTGSKLGKEYTRAVYYPLPI